MTSKKSKNFIIHFICSSLPILASRILGLIRDLFFAKYLGGTAIADIVLASFRIPNALRRAFGEGAVSNSFIPIFSEDLKDKKLEEARKFATQSYSVLFWFMLMLTALTEIFMPSVVRLIMPGFQANPEHFNLAVNLSRIVFPFLIFMSLYAFFTAILQSIKRFALAMAVNLILNIMLIASVIFFAENSILPYALSITYILASIVIFITTKFYSDRKYGKIKLLTLPKTLSAIKCKKIRLFLRNIVPGLLSTAIIFSSTIFASFYTGAVSWIYYAERLTQLPFGIIVIPLSTILLPFSSKAKTREEKFAYQNKAIELTSLMMIPCAFGLIFFGDMISSLIFERGLFTATDNLQTYKAIAIMAIGTVFIAYIRIVSTAFYTNKDTRTPFFHSLFSFAISLSFMATTHKTIGYLAIPIAGTLSSIILFTTLSLSAYKQNLFRIEKQTFINTGKIVMSSLMMGLSILLLSKLFLAPIWSEQGVASKIFLTTLFIGMGGFVYLTGLISTRLLTISYIKKLLKG